MINIKLNGKDELIKNDMNIENFLKEKGLKKESVVVMINENIIKKDNFKATCIKNKDEVEILRFVSGG